MVIQTDIYYFMAVSMVSPSIFVVIAKHEAWRTLNQMIKHNEIDKGCGGPNSGIYRSTVEKLAPFLQDILRNESMCRCVCVCNVSIPSK